MADDLDSYDFSMDDTVEDVFNKYFSRHKDHEPFILDHERIRVFDEVLKLDQEPALIGQAIYALTETEDLKALEHDELRDKLKHLVCGPVERILDFQFANKNLLIEALTHRSFRDAHSLDTCYEKLEVLGDAILDYLANSNLMNYTMFEKYNI